MTHSPLLSCVIPSYNYARYLPAALDSIVGQTYRNWELILVDNGSTDGSLEIAREYRARHPDRIKLIELPVNGPLATRIGMQHARGKYYAWMAADDVSTPRRFEDGVRFLEENPGHGAVFSKARIIDDAGVVRDDATATAIFNIPVDDVRQRLLHGNFLCFSSVVMRADAYNEIGGINFGYRKLVDFDLWLRILDSREIARTDDVWVHYRVHGSNNAIVEDNEDMFQSRLLQAQAIAEAIGRWPLDRSAPEQEGGNDRKTIVDRLLKLAHHCLSVDQVYFGRPLVTYHAAHRLIHQASLLEPENQYVVELLASVRHDLFSGQCGSVRANLSPLAEPNRDAGQSEADDRKKRTNAYGLWLSTNQLTPARRQWIREETASWESPPAIDVVMLVMPGQESLAEDTLLALRAQTYTHWRLHLLSFSPLALTPDQRRVFDSCRPAETVLGDDDDSLEFINRIVAHSTAGWFCQLWPGDLLAPEAFFFLLLAARKAAGPPVVLYCDEDSIDAGSGRRHLPLLKPDCNVDLLLGYNYIGQFALLAVGALQATGGFRSEFEGVEEHALYLDLLRRHGKESIVHVAEVLYSRHESGRHLQHGPDELWDLSCAVVERALADRQARVTRGKVFPLARIEFPLAVPPTLSVIVRDAGTADDLARSIRTLSGALPGSPMEVTVLAGPGHEEAAAAACAAFAGTRDRAAIAVAQGRNRGAQINRIVAETRSEALLLLDSTVSATDPRWLESLAANAVREDVGATGPRLIDGKQKSAHGPVVIGAGNRPAASPFLGQGATEPGHMLRAIANQDVSALSGAVLMVRRDTFLSVGGLDEEHLAAEQLETDLCLRILEKGLRVTLANDVVLSVSAAPVAFDAGAHPVTKKLDGAPESVFFCKRWKGHVANDPAYNKNLSVGGDPYALEQHPLLRLHPHWKPRPRVFTFPIDHFGCGEYRIKAPAKQLAQGGRIEGGWTDTILGPSEIVKVQADAFVFQRHETDIHRQFIQRCRNYSSAFTVLEIDDFIHGLTENRRDNRVLNLDRVAQGMEKSIRLCDRLVVSSPALAEEYGHLNADVVVVPNFIEDERWGVLSPRRRQGRKPRVGWAGGSSHFGDLLLIERVVRVLADEVDWVFLGICPESIRPWVHEFHPGVPIDGYPAKLASLDLDLALAPLERCRFNECKTPLRLLEYGILGYPVVCTDIVTFAGDFPVDRVPNETDAWVDAIRARIADRDELARAGDRMRQHVRAHWLLENNLDRWMAAWLPGTAS